MDISRPQFENLKSFCTINGDTVVADCNSVGTSLANMRDTRRQLGKRYIRKEFVLYSTKCRFSQQHFYKRFLVLFNNFLNKQNICMAD